MTTLQFAALAVREFREGDQLVAFGRVEHFHSADRFAARRIDHDATRAPRPENARTKSRPEQPAKDAASRPRRRVAPGMPAQPKQRPARRRAAGRLASAAAKRDAVGHYL